jgi:TatD DNase family protein
MDTYIDTHCHLDFPEFNEDRDSVVERAGAAGVRTIVNVGSSLKGSEDSVALSARFSHVYASVGIHPHEASKFTPGVLKRLDALTLEEKVVAIGEIGLDYNRLFSGKREQHEAFEQQLMLARKRNLAVVVHTRDADEDTLDMLRSYKPVRMVIHCFSGSREFLKKCLDLNALVSFTANITYKKAGDLRDVVANTPLERMMLETDAPFLSPEGLRGRRNEPSSAARVAGEIAAVKKIPLTDVAAVTTRTAKAFFGI